MTRYGKCPAWRDDALWRSSSFVAAWLAGWTWSTSRWMVVFAAPFLVQQETGSVLLAQLAGAALFVPTLLASRSVGILTDRHDQAILCLAALWLVSGVDIGLLVASLFGHITVWALFLMTVVTGVGIVFNMVTRRTLVYNSVPLDYARTAVALDSIAQYGSAIAGPLLAGALLAWHGPPALLTGLLVCNAVAIALVKLIRPAEAQAASAPVGGACEVVVATIAVDRSARTPIPHLVSLVGVTVAMNLCYFPSAYLIPALARDYHLDTVAAGVLGASAGAGAIAIGGYIVIRMPSRAGAWFTYGSMISIGALIVAGFARNPAVAFAALVLAGAGMAAFTAMQSVLVLKVAPMGAQGRAMGAISTAIGVLPLGGVILGFTASSVGASAALMVVSAVGLTALMTWTVTHRGLFRL